MRVVAAYALIAAVAVAWACVVALLVTGFHVPRRRRHPIPRNVRERGVA